MKTALALLSMSTLFAPAATAEDATGTGSGEATKKHPHDGLPEGALTEADIRINGVGGIKYNVPTTVEAFDTIAKKPGRALEAAISQTLFHGSYGTIRSELTSAISKRSFTDTEGNPRTFTPKLTTGKGVEVLEDFDGEGKLTGYHSADGKKTFKPDIDVKVESDGAFFTRVCAELGVEPNHFKDLIQEVANANPFDPSRKERTAGSRRIAKAYLEAAQQVVDNGEACYLNAAQQLGDLLEREVDVTDPETRVLVLATAIADNELREKREREAALKNKYTSFGA